MFNMKCNKLCAFINTALTYTDHMHILNMLEVAIYAMYTQTCFYVDKTMFTFMQFFPSCIFFYNLTKVYFSHLSIY